MTPAISTRTPWRACLWLLLCVSGLASAQTRAWLDRDAISEGDTVTLNIESDGGAPDYTPLQADFELSGQSSSRQVQWRQGAMQSRSLYGVALSPRRSGVLTIPPLRVGNALTAPLSLTVAASAGASAAVPGNAKAFVEVDVDDPDPYVQQSVGVVVRLYYASQLLSGELGFDAPDGASLQRVGEDRSLVRELNGRHYNVVERRYLLIPERSGPLLLKGARFNGRSAGGFFDDLFGGDGRLRASAPDRTLQVRAQPDAAPQPWLPLHDLRLRYTAAPTRGRAGEAITVVVEAVADGATHAQFPELPPLDAGPAAQVFAEPPQYDETFDGGSPRLTLTRRYSVVPRQPGTLAIPGLRMDWWDVRAGQARRASLPDLSVAVAAGAPGRAPAPLALDTTSALPDVADTVAPAGAAGTRPWGWIAAALAFAVLWLLTLAWGWRRRRRVDAAGGTPVVPLPAAGARRPSRGDLRRALDHQALDEIVTLLAAMGGVRDDLEAVVAQLAEPAQRHALRDLQAARWSAEGGDMAQARQALRRAFHDGPHWQAAAAAADTPLPPLYPPAR
ncbi:BatD family protein [Stenotrophomonas sp. NPDC077464]|uniref:BatD family protein n=1 Tax=unclassified Stenotrophomonas TaxID=196198 RepID=UPI0037D611D3